MTQHNRTLLPQCLLFLLSCFFFGCSQEEPARSFQGYAEGEYIYVSSPVGGTLERLFMQRGAQITVGDKLVVLESGLETAAVAEAEQGVNQVENRLADLLKGQRPDELSVISAQLDRARLALDQAKRELDRRQRLYNEKTIPLETLDQAKTLKELNATDVAEIAAKLNTAKLGGREDQINATRAEVSSARERLAQARWRLDQKTILASKAGYINDTFYVEGEFIPAGYPALSLLPPENITIRFFVPEELFGTLAIGQPIAVGFDGAANRLAPLSPISPQRPNSPLL